MPKNPSGTPCAALPEKTGKKVRTEWWNNTNDARKKRTEVSGDIFLGIGSSLISLTESRPIYSRSPGKISLNDGARCKEKGTRRKAACPLENRMDA
jgi:hypothetical protein